MMSTIIIIRKNGGNRLESQRDIVHRKTNRSKFQNSANRHAQRTQIQKKLFVESTQRIHQ